MRRGDPALETDVDTPAARRFRRAGRDRASLRCARWCTPRSWSASPSSRWHRLRLNRSRTGRDFTPGAIKPRLMFKGVQWTGDAETTEEVYDETHVTQSYDPSLDMLDPANPQNARWVKDHGDPGGRMSDAPTGEGGQPVTRLDDCRWSHAWGVAGMRLGFAGEVIYWRGPSPFHFVEVPPDQSEEIHAVSSLVTYGWGCIPVRARLGATRGRPHCFPRTVGMSCRSRRPCAPPKGWSWATTWTWTRDRRSRVDHALSSRTNLRVA